MIKISASIVIFNENIKILQEAIESFLAIELEKELVIVDNSSTDKLRKFCIGFKDTVYIKNDKNTGFGAGHNLAYKYISKKNDLHLVINPDVYFDSSKMKDFLLWVASQKDISLAVPKVYYPDGTIQNSVRDIPGIFDLIRRRFGFISDEIDLNLLPDISEIPFAHGCFFVFKTDIFEKLSGFDERFFLYMEDIDIFIRAKSFGRTIINQKYSIYHHHAKGSAKKFSLLYFHIVSAIKFFIKYRNIPTNIS